MDNITQIDNMTVIKQREVTEGASNVLIGFILLCCVWIVVVNSLTFLCLFLNRKSLKHFVTLQLLSLSMTDIVVGLTAIPGILTYYITSAFSSAEICAGIMYGYIVAQVASLFHVFAICLHRFITIKYHKFNSHTNGEGMLKRILYHILIVWISAIILVAIPVIRYAKFGYRLEECSLNTVFRDDYLKGFAVLAVFFITPQIGVNILYIWLFRFLSKQWNRIDTSKRSMASISVILENKSKVVVSKNTGSDLSKAEGNRISLNGGDRHNDSGYTHKDKRNLFEVKTDTETENEPVKESLKAIEINNSKDILTKLYRNKTETQNFVPGGYRKERDVLCTIGIVLLLLNICITPFNMTLLLELVLDEPLSRKVKFIFIFLALVNSGLNPIVYAIKMKSFRGVVSRYNSKCVAKCRL